MIEYGIKVKLGILPDPDDIEADPILTALFAGSIYIPDRLLEYCTITLAEDRKTVIMICIVCMMKRNADK